MENENKISGFVVVCTGGEGPVWGFGMTEKEALDDAADYFPEQDYLKQDDETEGYESFYDYFENSGEMRVYEASKSLMAELQEEGGSVVYFINSDEIAVTEAEEEIANGVA